MNILQHPIIALRSFIFYVVYFTFLISWLSLCLFFPLFMPKKIRIRLTKGVFGYGIALIARVICGVRYEIIGMENMPKDGRGYVFLSKHQSTWETFFFQYLIHPQCQVAKKELAQIPIFGWAFLLVDPILIDRSAPSDAMAQIIEKGTKRLNDGMHILLYPEGTRILPTLRKKFKQGGAVLAKAAQAPVIPVAHNAGDCWPKQGFLIYPGKINVVIGAAIETDALSQDELLEQVETWINTTVDDISAKPFSGQYVADRSRS